MPHAEIDALREAVLERSDAEGSKLIPWLALVDPGVTIPDFMARSSFGFMHHLASSPPVLRVLDLVFGGACYRYIGHNDIGIDRVVGWHKDQLNDGYVHYQETPLWGGASVATSAQGGHFIVKVLVYLEDHSQDADALQIVPGSHLDPADPKDPISQQGAVRVHPAKGDVLIMEQRATHVLVMSRLLSGR